ncbi:MAG: SMC-Scp complex subunit ScpB [Candidatus Nanohaloarchaea archaeon]|nr:SMC-Scp complex subunit ScpB [Candidatus Nanohaloarchaea archaeon]
MQIEEKKAVAEAALFLSEEPLTTEELADVMNLGSKGYVQDVVDELKEELDQESRGLKLVESEEGYELVVKSDLVDDVEHLAPHRDLNEAELRTLAVTAYNAPVKQSEIVEVRGNRAYSHLKELENEGARRNRPLPGLLRPGFTRRVRDGGRRGGRLVNSSPPKALYEDRDLVRGSCSAGAGA